MFPHWWPVEETYPSLHLERKELVKSSEEVRMAVQALFDSTWKETATRDRTDGSKAKRLRVVQVEHNMNHRSWVNYCNARQEVRDHVQQQRLKIKKQWASTNGAASHWPCLGELDG